MYIHPLKNRNKYYIEHKTAIDSHESLKRKNFASLEGAYPALGLELPNMSFAGRLCS